MGYMAACRIVAGRREGGHVTWQGRKRFTDYYYQDAKSEPTQLAACMAVNANISRRFKDKLQV
jgi:hypothetical protein